MTYVIKLEPSDKYNALTVPVAIPYGMEGYVPWDAIKYDDNVIDLTDAVSDEVKSSWIGGSMWGWDKKVAEAAVKYRRDVDMFVAMDNMNEEFPI